ncbi:MAG: hypothetical protein JNM50_15430 [Chromatiales bacterium]|nr:hypothetical protein [Chromatiales bacterium]
MQTVGKPVQDPVLPRVAFVEYVINGNVDATDDSAALLQFGGRWQGRNLASASAYSSRVHIVL